MPALPSSAFRIMLVPGLHDSCAGHWQTRWQGVFPGIERVVQDDWDQPDLARWSARLDSVRARSHGPTLLVAHSFGCLTAVHSIAHAARDIAGVLLVAPADPDKFGVADLLPKRSLACPSILISSSNDPWLSEPKAAIWARRWGSVLVEGGALGHINADSGLGEWPDGQRQLEKLARLAQERLGMSLA